MLSPQATPSWLFLLWGSWVGAAGGQLCPWLRLGVGRTVRGSCIRPGGHPRSGPHWPACSASLLPPPPRRAQILALLTPPNPARLSCQNHPTGSILARSLIHLPDPGPVAPEHSLPILPPHCFPLLLGLYIHLPLFTSLSLSLSLSTPSPLHTLPSCLTLSPLPCPLSLALPLLLSA